MLVVISNSIPTSAAVDQTDCLFKKFTTSKHVGTTQHDPNSHEYRWDGEYDILERKHGFIQWLYLSFFHPVPQTHRSSSFPIREHGMNFESQPLQPHELEAMKADPVIIERIISSYRLMLDFYGMRLVSTETGLISRSLPPRNYASRYNNLMRTYRKNPPHLAYSSSSFPGSTHNNLRISRILKCLSEVGLERLNAGFLLHVLNEQSENQQLLTRMLCSSMDRWWANCVRNEQERQTIAQLVRRVRQPTDGYVFTRDVYEKLLTDRATTGRLGEDTTDEIV